MRYLTLLLITVVLTILHTTQTTAAPRAAGDLDTTFGGFGDDGVVTVDEMLVNSAAVQSDGSIVVAGQDVADDTNFGLRRYFADGTVDNSFGNNGIIEVAIPDFGGRLKLLVQPSDDQLLLAYSQIIVDHLMLVVRRYSADGQPDLTYGNNGSVTVDFDGEHTLLSDAEIQPDGKVILGGHAFRVEFGFDDYDFVAVRLNDDGSLDTTFGSDGKQVVEFAESSECEDDFLSDVLLQADGKIVLYGSEGAGCTNTIPEQARDIAIARLTTSGALDTTFSGDGKVTIDLNCAFSESARAVVSYSDGRLLLAVSGSDCVSNDGDKVLRLFSDGSRDLNFGSNGVIDLANGSIRSVVIDSLDRWTLLRERYDIAGDFNIALSRHSDAAAPDTTFGDAGLTTFPSDSFFGSPNQLQQLPDNKLLFFDETHLFRAQQEGHFDTPGVVVGGSAFDETIYDLAIQADGKHVIVGSSADVTGTQMPLISRFSADGQNDHSFNNGFPLILDAPNGGDFQAVAIQPDGKIIAAGNVTEDVRVSRFHPDGTLDNSFGSGGHVTLALDGDERVAGIAQLPDGTIIVAGYQVATDETKKFYVARLTTNGALDTTFAAPNSWNAATIGSGFVDARAMVVMHNGDILIGGGLNGEFVTARFHADGTLATDGVQEYLRTGNDVIQTMAVLPDGRVALVGYSSGDWAIMLLNADGSQCSCGLPDGRLLTDFGSTLFIPFDAAVQADGKLLVVGAMHGSDRPNSHYQIGRYDYISNPTLLQADVSFADNGFLSFPIRTPSFGRAVALDGAQQIVVAGDFDNGHDSDWGVIRLQSGVSTPTSVQLVRPIAQKPKLAYLLTALLLLTTATIILQQLVKKDVPATDAAQ